MTHSFKYKPLGDNEVRVIRLLPRLYPSSAPLRATLDHITLDETFGCLSYVWGSDQAPETLVLDGCNIPIGRNLYDALVYFSPRSINGANCAPARCSCGSCLGPELWVDAICINQKDQTEKERLVAKMGLIYSQSIVWAWLGKAADNSDMAMDAIKAMKHDLDTASFAGGDPHVKMAMPEAMAGISAYFSKRLFHDGFATPELRALQEFFARPYWTRVWIIQEAILSRRVTFFCGTSSIEREDVRVVYLYLLTLFSGFRPWKSCTGDNIENISTTPTSTLGLFGPTLDAGLTLKQVLISCHISMGSYHLDKRKGLGMHATNPKDYIFGMAGLVSHDLGELGIEVNYGQSVQELFTQVMCAQLERRHDAYLVGLCQFPKVTSDLRAYDHY